MVRLNPQDLRRFLVARRADAALVSWMVHFVPDLPLDQAAITFSTLPAKVSFENREKLLAAVLHTALPDLFDMDYLAALRAASGNLGMGNEWLAHVVSVELGVTLEQLEAMCLLEVPPSCTPEDIKRAHRTMIKRYHPDRVAHLAPEFGQLARTRTMALNRARDVLTTEAEIHLQPAVEADEEIPLERIEEEIELELVIEPDGPAPLDQYLQEVGEEDEKTEIISRVRTLDLDPEQDDLDLEFDDP